MTYPSGPPLLRLRTPADVLAAVPYLLGFHPADSVVVLGLRDNKLVFHARGDLPPIGAPPADIDAFARYLGDLFAGQAATGVLLVGYGDPGRADPVMRAAVRSMRASGLSVVEALRAAGGRYWSYECPEPACCPPEGTAYEVVGSVIAAQATLAGCAALPDRESVVRTLDPPAGAALRAVEQSTQAALARLERLRHPAPCPAVAARVTHGWPPRSRTPRSRAASARPAPPVAGRAAALVAGRAAALDAGRAAVATAVDRYAAGGRLTDDELAWLTVLLSADPEVRDDAWERIDCDHLVAAAREVHERLWTDVLRRCAPRLAAAPGVLLGYASWRSGDGVRAGIAVDRALAAEPGYPAAQLLAELLRRAVRPPVAKPPRRYAR